jgi:hypothetical protein
MRSSFSIGIRSCARISTLLLLAAILCGCAQVSVTPQPAQPPVPSLAAEAIKAEPTVPAQVAVRDFTFNSSSVSENASPLHRVANLLQSSSAEERRIEIGRGAAARLSAQAAKRLSKMGLPAVRVPGDSDMPLYENTLLSRAA